MITPEVERDAPLGFEWRSGEAGRESRRLMGMPEPDIAPPVLDTEEARIEDFLDRSDLLAWMIEVDGEVVGTAEVHLKDSAYLPAPWVTVFIGETASRGSGVGTTVLRAVIAWLAQEKGEEMIFARYRLGNEASAQMLLKAGFEDDGNPYTDTRGIGWQNVILRWEEQ